MLVIVTFYWQNLLQREVIIFWKTFLLKKHGYKACDFSKNIVYLIFDIKLLFYTEIQRSFLGNI